MVLLGVVWTTNRVAPEWKIAAAWDFVAAARSFKWLGTRTMTKNIPVWHAPRRGWKWGHRELFEAHILRTTVTVTAT